MRAISGILFAALMILPAAGADKRDEGVAPPQLADAVTPIVRVPADFPSEAPETLSEGWVVVEFILTAQGRVEEPRAVRSSHKIFEAEALRSVRKWKFRPRMVDGAPVRTADDTAVTTHGVKTIVPFKRPEQLQWMPVRLPSGRTIEVLPFEASLQLRYRLRGKDPQKSWVFAVHVKWISKGAKRRKLRRIAKELMRSHVAAEIRQWEADSSKHLAAGSIVFTESRPEGFIVGARQWPGVHEFRFERNRRGTWRLER